MAKRETAETRTAKAAAKDAALEAKIAAKRMKKAAPKKPIAMPTKIAQKAVVKAAPAKKETSESKVAASKEPARIKKVLIKAPKLNLKAATPKKVVKETAPAVTIAPSSPAKREQVYFDKPRPPARPGTIREFVENLIMEHKLTDPQIHEKAMKAFDGGPIPAISSYRWAMRADRRNPPDKVVG